MLQPLPMQPTVGPDLANPIAPETMGRAEPGAFARALLQATQDDAAPTPDEAPRDTAAPVRGRANARQRGANAQGKQLGNHSREHLGDRFDDRLNPRRGERLTDPLGDRPADRLTERRGLRIDGVPDSADPRLRGVATPLPVDAQPLPVDALAEPAAATALPPPVSVDLGSSALPLRAPEAAPLVADETLHLPAATELPASMRALAAERDVDHARTFTTPADISKAAVAPEGRGLPFDNPRWRAMPRPLDVESPAAASAAPMTAPRHPHGRAFGAVQAAIAALDEPRVPTTPQGLPAGSGEARIALIEAAGLIREARQSPDAALPLSPGNAQVPTAAKFGSDIAPAAALASASVPNALTSREFAPAFVSQVALWVRDGVQEARLQLHPAELGPISIQIALDGTAAHIDFHAQHALTREAIEGSLPALASALRDAGFTLAGGGVFGQATGERGPGTPDRQPGQGRYPHTPTVATAEGDAPRRWRLGLIDVFA